MRRILSAPVGMAFLGLTSVASTAVAAGPPIIVAQVQVQLQFQREGYGWWEQEDRGDEARQRYWQLQRRSLYRYNQLQAEIYQLQRQREQIDARINADIAEEHQMLGY